MLGHVIALLWSLPSRPSSPSSSMTHDQKQLQCGMLMVRTKSHSRPLMETVFVSFLCVRKKKKNWIYSDPQGSITQGSASQVTK